MPFKINWDLLGIATSMACAIHCAILPLVLSSLPLFGINIIHNTVYEWGMIFLAFIVGTYSLIHGYRAHHRNLFPLLIFISGFIFLVLKQFLPSVEFLFLCFAVALIISAHTINYLYSRSNNRYKDRSKGHLCRSFTSSVK